MQEGLKPTKIKNKKVLTYPIEAHTKKKNKNKKTQEARHNMPMVGDLISFSDQHRGLEHHHTVDNNHSLHHHD